MPIEPIIDMDFGIDEITKTATLASYTGSGGDVIIPNSIGYNSLSSKTLIFNSMEDMLSGARGIYFFQDLYITLPNQKAQLIENPVLWYIDNLGNIQSSPQNYFSMTIQTVESYTIDQVDYAEFNQKMAHMATTLAFGPIQMIMQNMSLTSVDVQYGTEDQSFTFNMENYNAYMDGDDSPISTVIDDFMSKMESDPESLLPVTYSNFEYIVVVKDGEYSVTSIGESAFSSFSSLTSIEIPSSVTSIGSSAFNNCSALETITFGANSQLESIGGSAFSGCSNLTSITIPSNVTSIGDEAFESCSLETLTFEDADSIWVLNDNTEIIISDHTAQELADFITDNYTYMYSTWTKKQSA